MIDYAVIESNLSKLDLNSILVLKDNAYNCGLKEVLEIAYNKGFKRYAVITKEEALYLVNKYNDIEVLMLGKEKLIHKQVVLTVENQEDYLFCKNYNVKFHIKLKSKMNRFGFEYLPTYFNDDLCMAIYYHIGFNNNYDIKEEIKRVNKYADLEKEIHVGGSKMLNIQHKFTNRVGMRIYEGSKSLKGNIIKIFSLKPNEYLGYNKGFISRKDMLVGIVDIGYKNGLNAENRKSFVYINNKKYKLLGYKCMDYSFVEIDDTIKLNDEVEFLGKNININTLAKTEKRTIYEVFLNIK